MTSEKKCRHGNIIGSCYHDHCRQQNEPSKVARESFWHGIATDQREATTEQVDGGTAA